MFFFQFTAIAALLAVFHLVEVEGGSECVVNINGPFEGCAFDWRNETECFGAVNYMGKHLKCNSGSGDGCYMTLSGCDKELIKSIKKYRCKDIAGYIKPVYNEPPGNCVPRPKDFTFTGPFTK